MSKKVGVDLGGSTKFEHRRNKRVQFDYLFSSLIVPGYHPFPELVEVPK